jgi:hypothetical protein
MNFSEKVASHWTKERLDKLNSGRKALISPVNASSLLRCLGVMNADASISSDSMRKYIQINHLFGQIAPFLEDLNSRHKKVRILDAGSGSAFLTFLIAWAYKNHWNHPVFLCGIDSDKKLVEKSEKNAAILDVSDFTKFFVSSIGAFSWSSAMESAGLELDAKEKSSRPHVVMALHACDTATDEALALGIKEKSDFIAVAPCCHAELAKEWKKFSDQKVDHPFRPAFSNPHLRRELATHLTDLMRVLLLRSHGYEVTTTEFTMSHATPKNSLILATRRGNFHEGSRKEYRALVNFLNGAEISLAKLTPLPD